MAGGKGRSGKTHWDATATVYAEMGVAWLRAAAGGSRGGRTLIIFWRLSQADRLHLGCGENRSQQLHDCRHLKSRFQASLGEALGATGMGCCRAPCAAGAALRCLFRVLDFPLEESLVFSLGSRLEPPARSGEVCCLGPTAPDQSHSLAPLVVQTLKNLPAMQVTQVRSLGQEDPLEKRMATHSSILAWRIPQTEEPVGLQSMGHRVGND